jgi:hypothetical protein
MDVDFHHQVGPVTKNNHLGAARTFFLIESEMF